MASRLPEGQKSYGGFVASDRLKTLLKISWLLVSNRHVRSGWRSVALPISATIAVIMLLVLFGLQSMVQKEEAREEARSALQPEVESPGDLLIATSFDSWDGSQYVTAWIQSVSEAMPVLPPGVPVYPTPGQAVVSPALHALTLEYPELAARYPNHLVMLDDGLHDRGELLAYLRPQEGRTLTGNVQRVGSFGPRTELDLGLALTVTDPIDFRSLALGLIAFGGLPVALVAMIGARASSETRNHRFILLHWLGMSLGALRLVTAFESVFLTLPASLITSLATYLVLEGATNVPIVDHQVFAGDLAPSISRVVLVAFLVPGVMAFTSAILVPARARGTSRPLFKQGTNRNWIFVPVILCLVALGLLPFVSFEWLFEARLLAIVLAIMTTVLVLPIGIQLIGSGLAMLPSAVALLAGRTLDRDANRSTRPFTIIAVAVILAFVGVSYVHRSGTEALPAIPNSNDAAATVQWMDPQSADFAVIVDGLHYGIAVPFGYLDQGVGQPPQAAIGATCFELQAVLQHLECDDEVPLAFSERNQQILRTLVPLSPTGVMLVPRETFPINDQTRAAQALIVAPVSAQHLHNDLSIVSLTRLTAPFVSDVTDLGFRRSPLNDWINAGVAIGVAMFAVAALLLLIDGYLDVASRRRRLLALGVSRKRLTELQTIQIIIPYLAILAVSSGVGVAVGYPFVSRNESPPLLEYFTVLGAGVVVGVVIALVVSISVHYVYENDGRRATQ